MSLEHPTSRNLLDGPAPVLLPTTHPDTAARAALAAGSSVRDAVRQEPASSYLWALLAEEALAPTDDARPDVEPDPVAAYAYARTGYHRGLDALRRAGWKGYGPVPWSHAPNRGFLRALNALGRAAGLIGETAEADRITTFLVESDPEAARVLQA